MNNQELYDLIACFDRSGVQTLKLSRQDFSIELSKNTVAAATSAAPVAVSAAVSAPAAAAAPAVSGSLIHAPLVGTFYLAPAPDQPPFVTAGDRVAKGQTVCLIEAMKMMSEVPAPCDCIIEEVLQESGALVAFDAPLVRYREV